MVFDLLRPRDGADSGVHRPDWNDKLHELPSITLINNVMLSYLGVDPSGRCIPRFRLYDMAQRAVWRGRAFAATLEHRKGRREAQYALGFAQGQFYDVKLSKDHTDLK